MADTLETLFSFELMVDFIRIDKLKLKPAVGVRLLDFPTLLVYPKDSEESVSQDDSDSEKENISASDGLHQPQSASTEYSFQRGKSCLFKIRLDTLHAHLSNTPLYVMVLDLRSNVPKFLGGSLISLDKLTDGIKADVNENGICTPSCHGERSLFAICNLMGEKIGYISLGYKLLSLGATLIPHIPESRIYKVSSAQRTPTRNLLSDAADTKVNSESDPAAIKPHVNEYSVLNPKAEIEGKLIDLIVSDAKSKAGRAKSTGTQTEHTKKKAKLVNHRYNQTTFENEMNPDIFCPPPLYYSRSEKERNSNRYQSGNFGREVLVAENNSEDETQEHEKGNHAQSVACHSRGISTSNTLAQQTTVATAALGDALRQMPLLNSLLAELSQLYIQTQQQIAIPIQPLARLCQPTADQPCGAAAADEECRPWTPNASASPTHGSKMPRGPNARHSTCLVCAEAFPSSSTQKTRRAKQSSETANPPKQSPPKRKLVYGLTNTLRLRLQQTNPEVLKVQERMEQRRKGQVDKLKCINNQRHSRAEAKGGQKVGEVLNRGNKMAEHVQRISSEAIAAPQLHCAPSLTRSGQENGSSKPEGRGQFCPSSPLRAVCGSNPETKMLTYHQDKDVHVHIPSALGEISDTSDEEESHSGVGHPTKVHSTSLAEKMSIVSSPDPRCSHSESGNLEPVEYPDDFNSFDLSESCSPDLLSSPDPILDNERQDVSMHCFNSDSDSQSRRRAALPVPIRADISPKRSLKGTHVLEPRTQKFPVSLSSDDGESRSASTHSGRLRPQQVVQAPSTAAPERSASPLKRSGTQLARYSRDTPSMVDSSVPTDTSESISSPDPKVTSIDLEDEEMEDALGSLGLVSKYHHVSELIVNKLPGYTL
ncbi:microtubule-associated protein 10 [Brienomyrus brachyistius]|uniref:microtubule-associated protein 10 n=1 Tax=Brienomyrus brachyistius TaxID=42636 RepID=UPI0020B32924|nr:microtubule-associated protein 10 [Brienomyrus brachyistius]